MKIEQSLGFVGRDTKKLTDFPHQLWNNPTPELISKLKAEGYDGFKRGNNIYTFDSTAIKSSPSIPKELEPLAAEARKYKSADGFLYHGTTEARAMKIADSGLLSGKEAGNTAAKDVYLSNTEQYAKSYADRKGGTNSAILRVVQSPEMIGDVNTGLKGDFKTSKGIAPENIQIKGKDGNWYGVKDYNFETGKGTSPMGIPKVLEPLAEHARQFATVEDFLKSDKFTQDKFGNFCI